MLSITRLIQLLLIGLAVSGTTTDLKAQLWDKFFERPNTDVFYESTQADNEDYISVGFTETGSANSGQEVWIVRFDLDGDILWEKTLGGSGDQKGYSIVEAQDGYVIVGDYTSMGGQNNPTDIFIIKINEAGEILWTRNYGNIESDKAWKVKSTSDGNFVLVGRTENPTTGDADMFILKTDSNGDSLWMQTFDNQSEIDEAFDVIEISNGFVLLGNSGNVGADIFLVQTDENGNEVRRSTFNQSGSFKFDSKASILRNGDNYLIAGSYFENGIRAFIAEFDNLLDFSKIRFYGNGIEQGFTSMIPTSDGNFLAVGFQLKVPSDPSQVFMVQVDPNLDLLSSRVVFGDPVSATNVYGVMETSDNGFALTGNFVSGIFLEDGFFLKTEPTLYAPKKLIEGKVFFDATGDGTYNNFERTLNNWIVSVEDEAGQISYYTTDAQGNYEARVDSGEYKVSVIVDNPTLKPRDTGSYTVRFIGNLDTLHTHFPIVQQYECAYMEVDVSVPFLKICETTDYTITYCNKGADDATEAIVELTFDENLIVNSFSIPGTATGNVFTFNLGEVPAGDCGQFTVNVTLDCDNPVLGQSHCVRAHIYPDTICKPVNPIWDLSDLEVEAICENDTVKFTVTNKGTGTMVQGRTALVIEDEILFRPTPVQLTPNQDTLIAVPADGKTYRIIMPQAPGHPGLSMPTIAMEGCTDGSPITLGKVTQFEEDEKNSFEAVECIENIDQTISAELRGYPKGINDSLITTKTDLEYFIQFQNKGTNTIHRVAIRDTIDIEHLDIASIRPGASSHPYSFKVFQNGVVKIILDSIDLPGEQVNAAASVGFVKFRISQKPGNPAGTSIPNKSVVSFDYNQPLTTNTTRHYIEGDTITDIVTMISDVNDVNWSGVDVKVYPNPFMTTATMEIEGDSFKEVRFEVYDLNGKLLRQETFFQNTFEISKGTLSKGMYLYSVRGDGQLLNTGKIVIH
ncbi:MAG: T9SS type A sorting domain-containing protein [Saprospiraceae bacterium]|nr:T9SS type A sorting domain-containing protein [Saprospiraceae bacterium]